MKKVWVILDRRHGDALFSYKFYETEKDAERAVAELKEYGYDLYVIDLGKFHERDEDYVEMSD